MFAKALDKLPALAVAALALVVGTSAASASVLTFGGFVTTTDNLGTFPTPVATIDDNTAGFLTFSIGSTGVFGKLSGVFFDVSGKTVAKTDIVNSNVTIQDFATNTYDVTHGVTMAGGYDNGLHYGPQSLDFDFGFRINRTDVTTTPLTFKISTSVLTLADFEGAGFRFQSVSGTGVTQDSAKILGYPTVPTVPVPASALLLLGGLGGLAALRRRKAA